MRINWLNFSTRSPRQPLPVLMWPAFTATVRSEINVSIVSPLLWETETLISILISQFNRFQGFGYRPYLIQFDHNSIETPFTIPSASISLFVQNILSPTISILLAQYFQIFPPGPAVFSKTIFNKNKWDIGWPSSPIV